MICHIDNAGYSSMQAVSTRIFRKDVHQLALTRFRLIWRLAQSLCNSRACFLSMLLKIVYTTCDIA